MKYHILRRSYSLQLVRLGVPAHMNGDLASLSMATTVTSQGTELMQDARRCVDILNGGGELVPGLYHCRWRSSGCDVVEHSSIQKLGQCTKAAQKEFRVPLPDSRRLLMCCPSFDCVSKKKIQKRNYLGKVVWPSTLKESESTHTQSFLGLVIHPTRLLLPRRDEGMNGQTWSDETYASPGQWTGLWCLYTVVQCEQYANVSRKVLVWILCPCNNFHDACI